MLDIVRKMLHIVQICQNLSEIKTQEKNTTLRLYQNCNWIEMLECRKIRLSKRQKFRMVKSG